MVALFSPAVFGVNCTVKVVVLLPATVAEGEALTEKLAAWLPEIFTLRMSN